MAEPSPKRLKSGLPLCTIHRHGRALSPLVKQNFPSVVEEGLCGVTSAVLEASYVFQMLYQTKCLLVPCYSQNKHAVSSLYVYREEEKGEIFDLSDMSLSNVSKFFWEQAKEEREAAEVLIQYQHDRGGLYCTKVIQKPHNVCINGVAAALEVASIHWKTLAGYFEDLYALSIKNSDPHTASTIKKQFLAPKIQKIKLMGDLITNALRLRSAQDGRSDFENYLIDRLQKELRTEPDLEALCSPHAPLQKCAGTAKVTQLLPEKFPKQNNNIKTK